MAAVSGKEKVVLGLMSPTMLGDGVVGWGV